MWRSPPSWMVGRTEMLNFTYNPDQIRTKYGYRSIWCPWSTFGAKLQFKWLLLLLASLQPPAFFWVVDSQSSCIDHRGWKNPEGEGTLCFRVGKERNGISKALSCVVIGRIPHYGDRARVLEAFDEARRTFKQSEYGIMVKLSCNSEYRCEQCYDVFYQAWRWEVFRNTLRGEHSAPDK